MDVGECVRSNLVWGGRGGGYRGGTTLIFSASWQETFKSTKHWKSCGCPCAAHGQYEFGQMFFFVPTLCHSCMGSGEGE